MEANYGNSKHKHRVERIQETGGRLRGGTNGNVWEWGPLSAREDYMMEMSEETFETFMDHCESTTDYEKEVKELKAALRMVLGFAALHNRDSDEAWVACQIQVKELLEP